MDIRAPPTASFLILVFLSLLLKCAESQYFSREDYCVLYSSDKGTVDPKRSRSLSECQMYCQLRDTCVKSLFLWRFECCVYYETEEDYEHACSSIKVKSLADSSGCESRHFEGQDGLQSNLKITPPPQRTTTTPTPAPAPDDDQAMTTVSMTTAEATTEGQEEEDAPVPEGCEEVVVSGVAPYWTELQAKLQNETAGYSCHQLCRGPAPPDNAWQKAEETKPTCTSLSDYDSSVCASFLNNLVRRWNPHGDQQLTLILCQSEAPSDVTTESSVTGSTEAGVTGSTVTGATESDVTTADVTSSDVTSSDVTSSDVTSSDVTSAEVTGDDVTGATEASETTESDVTGATEAPGATDSTVTGGDVTGDDVTGGDVTSAAVTGDDVTGVTEATTGLDMTTA